MRLIDLEPSWLSKDVFIFRNPTGGKDWLTCKRVEIRLRDQYKLIYEDNSRFIEETVVMTRPEFAWKFEGSDFNIMTVSPSIDASASGNWHGFIVNGEIR